jgi:hypothetical protein
VAASITKPVRRAELREAIVSVLEASLVTQA